MHIDGAPNYFPNSFSGPKDDLKHANCPFKMVSTSLSLCDITDMYCAFCTLCGVWVGCEGIQNVEYEGVQYVKCEGV